MSFIWNGCPFFSKDIGVFTCRKNYCAQGISCFGVPGGWKGEKDAGFQKYGPLTKYSVDW